MYTITFPIPAFPIDEKHISISTGLARDVLTQLKYEPKLRLICPTTPNSQLIADRYDIDLEQHPGLSFRLLPWDGGRRSWPLKFLEIRKILIEEARRASVWHSCCSMGLWDLEALSYQIGSQYARGSRVFCLDSDPAAMLKDSGGWGIVKAPMVRSALSHRTSQVDGAIFLGKGVSQNYGSFAKHSITTDAVWLQTGDLANEEDVKKKFQNPAEPVRIILPSRLMPWKGVDDTIQALIMLRDQLPPWELDIIGEGPEKNHLISLTQKHTDRIRFLDPVPYGPQFFEKLRSYHIAIVPTRALETQRITYDAAASGCVLIHSGTVTLEEALRDLKPRWSFEPGNVQSLASTVASAFAERDRWLNAGLAGIVFSRGRTIDEMHRLRAEFVRSLHTSSVVSEELYAVNTK